MINETREIHSALYGSHLGVESVIDTISLMNPTLKDSTVLKVFQRNQTWNNLNIVCDITGSMSPYIAQVLVWYQIEYSRNPNKVISTTFFNDGDNTPDNQKKIGTTGGIYHVQNPHYSKVESTIFKAVMNGGGGDAPENDIEAILATEEKLNKKANLVLVADNYTHPRDMILVEKINNPVKVIVCGSEREINSAYLDLARATGGSIHTIEDDIYDLMKLSEGEEIKIANHIYIVSGNHLKKVIK